MPKVLSDGHRLIRLEGNIRLLHFPSLATVCRSRQSLSRCSRAAILPGPRAFLLEGVTVK